MDIAEVARRSGVAASTLRFYEEKGLIASIGRQGLRRRFDPAKMLELDIYPGQWDEPPEDEDPLGELISYFAELRKFVSQVAQRGHSLLVHIG